MARSTKIQYLQNEYKREITLCQIRIDEEKSNGIMILTEVEKAKIELYQQLIKDIDKLKTQ
jgi:Ni,Fe-hydrogenase maturation factor